jgi:hypothetical protein
MFRLLCFAIIRLLHYLLDTYMCKTIGWDILVISRESVAGNVVFSTPILCIENTTGMTDCRFPVHVES